MGVGDGQGGLACCSPWGCKESDMTEWLNWTDIPTGHFSSLVTGFHINVYKTERYNWANVVQSLSRVPILCNTMDCSTPGFPVFHFLPVSSTSCLLSQWCHPTISPSVSPFSSCPQSFPASGSFPMSWLFTSGCQSIEASASATVKMLIQLLQWDISWYLYSYFILMECCISNFGEEGRCYANIVISFFFPWKLKEILTLWSCSHCT